MINNKLKDELEKILFDYSVTNKDMEQSINAIYQLFIPLVFARHFSNTDGRSKYRPKINGNDYFDTYIPTGFELWKSREKNQSVN